MQYWCWRGIASLACGVRGDRAEGVTQAGQALALFQQTGDQTGQGWARAALAEHHARLGNYELARGYARRALEVGPATSNLMWLAVAWDALGVAHARPRRGTPGDRVLLAGAGLVRELKHQEARSLTAVMLAESGDACQAAGDLPAAVEAWQQALQVLRDLGWPDRLGVGARLGQAGPPGPPGSPPGGRRWLMAVALVRCRPTTLWAIACRAGIVSAATLGARLQAGRGTWPAGEGRASMVRARAVQVCCGPAPGAHRHPGPAGPGRRAAGYRVPVTCRDTVSTPPAHQALAW